MDLLELPSMRQPKISFSRGEIGGEDSAARTMGSPFSSFGAASTRLGPSGSRMHDKNAGGKIVSPIITSSRDLMNRSQVMALTKYPLAPARNAEANWSSR